jgi:hypothetical protein
MKREHAIDLLSAHGPLAQDLTEADRLAAALGDLPLALDHAAAFCRMSGAVFSEYRARITDMIRLVPSDASYRGSVHAAISLGYDATSEEDKGLLHRLAFLAPDHLGIDMLSVAEPDLIRRVKIMQSLAALALVIVDDKTLRMHRLAQDVIRQRFFDTHDFSEIRSDLQKMVKAAFASRRPGVFDPMWDLLLFAVSHDPDPDAKIVVDYDFNDHLDVSLTCEKRGNAMWIRSQVFAHHGQVHYGENGYTLTDRWERLTN